MKISASVVAKFHLPKQFAFCNFQFSISFTKNCSSRSNSSERLDDKESYIVMGAASVSPIDYVAVNEVDQLTRAQMAASQSRGDQTLAAVLFAGGVHRFRHPVSVEHQHLSRLDRRVILVVTRITKHSQRHAAAFFKVRFPVRIDQ